jgi:hypothetical protein
MKASLFMFICLLAALIAAGATADDATQTDTVDRQQTPPMGPPPEMKEISWLVGDWNVTMKSGMDPDTTTWTESQGTCTYKYVLGGAAMQFEYKGEAMGMPFEGMAVQCFDRETGMWQMSWTDNMSGRLSLYTGKRADHATVVIGEDIYNGQTYITRITSYNETSDAFDWKMEYSTDGGQTFLPSARAKYTRTK